MPISTTLETSVRFPVPRSAPNASRPALRLRTRPSFPDAQKGTSHPAADLCRHAQRMPVMVPHQYAFDKSAARNGQQIFDRAVGATTCFSIDVLHTLPRDHRSAAFRERLFDRSVMSSNEIRLSSSHDSKLSGNEWFFTHFSQQFI